MSKCISAIIYSLFTLSVSLPAHSYEIKLRDSILKSLSMSSSAKILKLQRKLSQQKLITAKGALIPNFSINASATQQLSSNNSFSLATTSIPGSREKVELKMSMPIISSASSYRDADIVRNRMEEFSIYAKMEKIAISAVNAHLDLSNAIRIKKVLQKTTQHANLMLNKSKILKQNGAISDLGYLEFVKRHNEAESKYEKAVTDEQNARSVYCITIGSCYLGTSLDNTYSAPITKIKSYNIPKLLAQNSAENAALLKVQYREAMLQYAISKSSISVSANAGISATSQTAHPSSGTVTTNSSEADASIVFGFPVFNSQIASSTQETEIGLEVARNEYTLKHQNLVEKVSGLYNKLTAVRSKIKFNKSDVKFQINNVSAKKTQLENGTKTSTDVMKAENDLAAAQVKLLTAENEYTKLSYELTTMLHGIGFKKLVTVK